MNLILHHLRKDIRAHQWSLLFLFFIVALRITLDWLETLPDYHLANQAEFIRSSNGLTLAGFGIWTILLARLIQSEPVTGQSSFWLTRPITRGIYIPSKLIFIALFLVLPFLIPEPLDMLRYNVDSSRIGDSIKDSLLLDAYLIILVLWLATFTRSITQFVVAVVVFIVACVVVELGAFEYLRSTYGHASISGRQALFTLILLSGLFVSLWVQHTRRKSSAGFTLGIASTVLAFLLVLFTPFALPEHLAMKLLSITSTFGVKTTEVKFTDDWQNGLSWLRNPETQEWILTGAFRPVPATPPPIPIIQYVSVQFQYQPGNPENLSNGTSNSFPADLQFDCPKAIAAEFPGIRFTNLADSRTGGSMSLFVLDATHRNLLGKTGRLTLTFTGSMQSLEREAAIPLSGPRMAREPGEIIHVIRLPDVPHSDLIQEPVKRPVLAVWNLGFRSEERFVPPDRYYLLVDPQENTGTFLHTVNDTSFNLGLAGISSKFSRHTYLSLAGDEPLDRMVLYIYEFKKGDDFYSTVTVPNFTMNPAP